MALTMPQAGAQNAAQQPPSPVDFTCPMDPDVRSKSPGKCPRCGMALEARIQEPARYVLRVVANPRAIPVGKPVELTIELVDPVTKKRATKFEVMHEKLFHMFLVSADLSYFVHDHPAPQPDGTFRYVATLPKPGIYKMLADTYPSGGTPQLLPAYLTTAGYARSIAQSVSVPAADFAAKPAENMRVSLRMEPARPVPGKQTMLFFSVEPGDGLQQYLGAWGHLLAASDDLIDTIHEHPIYADGKPQVQFNIIFPREATYRVWVQFQREGVVNTAAFTIPVKWP